MSSPQAQPIPAAPADAVLEAFTRAATRVPAYRALLAQQGIAPGRITDLAAFQRHVPIVDKHQLFGAHPVERLCVDGCLEGARSLYTSSGYSGVFSFGVETWEQNERLTQRVDELLDQVFAVRERPSLLVNALPPGVEVPTGAVTSITVGPRPEAALAAIGSASASFEQTILAAEQPLVKEILDLGAAQAVDWSAHNLRIVTGAEVMPENFRRYVQHRLGDPPDGAPSEALPEVPPEASSPGRLLLSLGISEVSLSLGIETPLARGLRQSGHGDPRIGRALFGVEGFVPTVAQYDPGRFHLETAPGRDGRPSLVVTTLDPERRLPLIRYGTGDWAQVLSPRQMNERLAGAGLAPVSTVMPFVLLFGRGRCVEARGGRVYPEQVKERLYQDFEVARQLTGAFRLRGGEALSLVAQLNKRADPDAAQAVSQRLGDLLEGVGPGPTGCEAWGYDRYARCYGTSFQRKFRYL